MRKYILTLSIILWMAIVIFYLSHQPASSSNDLSTGITEVILNFFHLVTPWIEIDVEFVNHIVRKNAHFFAYLILGLLTMSAIRHVQNIRLKEMHVASKRIIKILKRKQRYQAFFFSVLICLSYAISDEIHQLFVPGRSGEVKDVMIDTCGAIVGMSVYLLIEIWKKR